MGTTPTTNYNLLKPIPFEEEDTWGQILNDNWDKVDAQMKVNADAIATKAGLGANTYTASQTIAPASGDAFLIVSGLVGTTRGIALRTSNSNRFTLGLNTVAESGGNAGSNFYISRLPDTDTGPTNTLTIDRATGLTTLESLSVPTINLGSIDTTISRVSAGVAAIEGDTIATLGKANVFTATQTMPAINVGNADTQIIRTAAGVLSVAGGILAKEDRANTFTTLQTIDGGANGLMRVGGDVGTQRGYLLRTAAASRWGVLTTGGAEGGANAGSDFQIVRYTDAGSAIDAALTINRSTGNVGIGAVAGAYRFVVSDGTTNMVVNPSGGVGSLGTSSNHPVAFLTVNAERARIDASGNFLVGRTALSAGVAGFYVSSVGASRADLAGSGQNVINKIDTDGTAFRFDRAQTNVGSINVTTTATSYNTTSDYRVKTEVQPMANAIDDLMALKPSTFEFINERGTRVPGFIAHEVQAVVPTAVTGEKDAMHVVTEDEATEQHRAGTMVPSLQSMDLSKLVPLLTGAAQELVNEVRALIARITLLETRVEALEAKP